MSTANVTEIAHNQSTRDAAAISNDFWSRILACLKDERGLNFDVQRDVKPSLRDADACIPDILTEATKILFDNGLTAEAEALGQVHERTVDQKAFGGLEISTQRAASESEYEEVAFLVQAYLRSLSSSEKSRNFLSVRPTRAVETKPMTMAQKIFAQHVIGHVPPEGLQLGDVVRVGMDWILASELSWSGMERIHQEIGSPGIWRNDRFWLAGDHVIHPDVKKVPKIRAMVDTAEKAKKDFKMTEYQGMNYTIMHTEFVRERAEPGMLVLGSDSHTCSAGAVSCLAIGLGGADVMMSLSLGETWFKIPESILIEFVGQPAFGMSGKDVILYILKQLKRNTVAAERIVEFAGEGAKHLSCDARFAICNMCTEFGAITGVFVPDDITQEYISHRRRKANRSNSIYFKPDPDAVYAGKYTIDLSQVEASIAVYPEPDNVVPVSEKADMHLDGVFIGACTTTEEELVLAALVLKVGLQKKLPLSKGKRHYVPGSLPIVEKLKDLCLLEIYEAAGFTRGPPGCSYCVGLSAEKASAGETWLSSQNRNFKNRMGPGSFGSITSAIVCAASSFSMSPTDPRPFLKEIDASFFARYSGLKSTTLRPVEYVEPALDNDESSSSSFSDQPNTNKPQSPQPTPTLPTITSNIVTLGDFIDTDALAPGTTLTTCVTDADFGQHVLENTHPDFRAKVKSGLRVVVAGKAFGVGSSRECAVSALKGAGVQAVIARSFAFIYGRNQPSLGLLGIVMEDVEFYEVAEEGKRVEIDVANRKIKIDGNREFGFKLSDIEYGLTANKGIAEAYKRFGKGVWEEFTKTKTEFVVEEMTVPDKRMEW